jgi:cytochrome d ubiquinol oxidase subunit I
MSAFWILSANSWMQTPSGVELREGIFHVTDWPEVIFSPSFPYRFVHMLLASYLTTAFVVGGVASWYLLRNEHLPFARKTFSMSMAFVAVLAPLQILAGDLHGLNTYQHQPAKVAAMEGLWETTAGAPFKVFAWPDMEAELNHFEFRIPYGSSLILEHSPGAEVSGLREWPRDERPNVAITFFSFRIMMAIGFFMLAVAMAGLWLRYRARLFESRALLRSVIIAGPLGFVATLAGWVVAEVGRQPWVVYGMMRTSDAVSPIPAQAVVISLSLFIVIYLLVFLAYLYYLLVMVRNGPDYEEPAPRGAPVRTVWLGSDWRRN